MTKKSQTPEVEFDDESDEQDVAEELTPGSVAAVVTGTDWTTETIVSQLKRRNIQLNPRFQRRDAWKRDRKSRFIESLIVGLPIPQIVLAESKEDHWHPTGENVTVVQGSLSLGMGNSFDVGLLHAYGVGDFAYLPPQQSHYGQAHGATIVQINGRGPFAINPGAAPK
jgi:hypothetical protein